MDIAYGASLAWLLQFQFQQRDHRRGYQRDTGGYIHTGIQIIYNALFERGTTGRRKTIMEGPCLRQTSARIGWRYISCLEVQRDPVRWFSRDISRKVSP